MDIAAINPLALPSLLLSQRPALPDMPGVYFALADDNMVLYIGKTRRLSERWKSRIIAHFNPALNRGGVDKDADEKVGTQMQIPRDLYESIKTLAFGALLYQRRGNCCYREQPVDACRCLTNRYHRQLAVGGCAARLEPEQYTAM